MVLYHAVSSYQLLEVWLHRLLFHGGEPAALLLPDFIEKKYPQYKRLAKNGAFQWVGLFPYLRIPHLGEKEIFSSTCRAAEGLLPLPIRSFSQIYVAGSHFYFSLYLIQRETPFVMLEDAAGLLSRPEELYLPLLGRFPVQARLAEKYGLLDGSQPLITRVVCLKSVQTMDVSGERYWDFSVEKALEALEEEERRKIRRFFLRRRIFTRADTILLTQQLSDLGILTPQGQREAYRRLWREYLCGGRLLVKLHPDDTLDYRGIFPGARFLRRPFPAELLPYVFYRKPERLFAFSSSCCANLGKHFKIEQIGREFYESFADADGG